MSADLIGYARLEASAVPQHSKLVSLSRLISFCYVSAGFKVAVAVDGFKWD